MKFSVSWLKDYLETSATASEIADACTRIGLEVEGIENPADKLAAFRIAKVLSAAPHPQADKLQVLSVDAGGVPLQVVCGAPNARAGMIGVFGPAGAVVPSNGMGLKVAAIRGVESNGMMCSSRELELGDDHDGIIELAGDAPVGMAYADWAGLDDAVIDVAVTPNKQDCMGVYGIARDLAAAGVGTLKPLVAQSVAGTFPCPTHIRTDDSDGCPAFYGRVIRGVTNPASPDWMQARLKAVGQRPISALVDITNYVMLSFGRPSHAYDLAKLTGAVFARRAVEGESVTVLNGKAYTLTAEMTVIADEAGVHDIAGIMGGEHSGCSEGTTDVLLEVAYFTPESIARTGQALSLTSDARTRFERGVDPAFLDQGLEIITQLILDICGGEASEIVRAGTPPLETKTIAYDPTLCARLGGVDVAPERQREILVKLGFLVSDDWHVTAPTWRRDVDGSPDIVEEIVRMVGLDNVPSTPLPRAEGVTKPTATPAQMIERKVRRTAAARGLNEAITWSFLSEAEAAAFGGGAWTLANPISEDMKVMRPTMLAGLLSAAARNANRGADSIRLFEIGRRYLADSERATVGVVLAGNRRPRGWATGKPQAFDAYDAKAEALALLAAAGAPVDNLQVMGEADAHFHPGQSGTLRLGPKTILASFGMLHPTTAKAFDLSSVVVAAEIYLDTIPAKRGGGFMRSAYTPPALQAVTRDFAFVVPASLASADLIRAVKGADKANITAARLFDVFARAGVADGHVSLGIEVTLQPVEKSYGEADLKAIADRIVAAAAKSGAVLRG
jgi:phenylalanyl-tRNA synthetase beta chain